MSNLFPSCSGFITEDVDGVLLCSTGWEFTEVDSGLSQLTAAEIGQLSTAVVTLFAIAFAFRFVRRFMVSSIAGRNG